MRSFLVSLLALALVSCTEARNVVQILKARPDLSTLVTAVGVAGLEQTLEGPGPFTVFAPTNEAFSALPAGVLANLLKPNNKAALVKLLTYHVVAAAAFVKDLRNGEQITTVEKDNVTVTLERRLFKTIVKINNATVTKADINASNGVIHIIDTVLMPPSTGAQDIVKTIQSNPDLSTLATAVGVAGLEQTLEGPGPFTVFAPTNEAFSALPAGVLANLLKPTNKAALIDVLTYHVLGNEVPSQKLLDGEMLRTLEQKYVTVRIAGKAILINTALVTTADVQASNGVIHIIDAVLLPPSGPSPPPPPATNHLWFRGFTCEKAGTGQRCTCGEVDAAARMPPSLFDPSNKAALERYINITNMFYTYGLTIAPLSKLEVGRCRDAGYTDGPNVISGISWTGIGSNGGGTDVLMGPICEEQCHCSYPSYPVYNPALPGCPDAPDDPANGKFCSLCGPKYNAPIDIDLFNGPCRPKDIAHCFNGTKTTGLNV